MKTTIRTLSAILAMALLAPLSTAQSDRQSQPFKLHNIFGSHSFHRGHYYMRGITIRDFTLTPLD
jgi:hypothetical protein